MRQLRPLRRTLSSLLTIPFSKSLTPQLPFQSRTTVSSQLTTDSKGYRHFGKRRSAWSLPLQLGIFGGVCTTVAVVYSSRRETVPYSGRRHAIFISVQRERELGNSVFEQFTKQVKLDAILSGTLLPESNRYTQLVKQVGKRISAVAGDGYGSGYTDHLKDLDWQFIVVNNGAVNAFVVPGGKVVVYSGLLKVLKTVDELAAVLAHEVGHVVARHTAERVSEMGVMAVVRFLVAMMFGFPLPPGLGTVAIALPHSRRAETEADLIGLRLMSRACFHPAAAESMLLRLDALERHQNANSKEGNTPLLLRTHPITSDRVLRVKEDLPEALQLYEDGHCGQRQTHFGTRFRR